ncbi:TPA: hypothetical protein ACJCQR_000638 [Neisseria meningitidis]|uniref:hypothetical protein n=1 Tax=Neisseria meningitidis TaxID=487 RepID=UPI00186448BE|nr:hypothetical protein [Neisseria meningitidis]MBH2049222.1 hypothetical protein [Neisseria meningitidis]MBH2082670.1 hypothetical protein [Neisseria meningitidis]MBH2250290.1 hypothetical protein [Neisseria meningitidis]MBH5611452.1 hypothetical protein [Neisseria meningitidis]MBH5667133.1 hypothetical protein [Neisseria meningitidis]
MPSEKFQTAFLFGRALRLLEAVSDGVFPTQSRNCRHFSSGISPRRVSVSGSASRQHVEQCRLKEYAF